MKLNNHGWGLKEMIIFCCFLLLFFIITIYYLNVFYSSLGREAVSGKENVDTIIYQEMEEELEKAAKNYILETGTSYSMVSAQTLIKTGYLKGFNDPTTDESCHGYVNINNDSYDGYISCGNYITEGYGD